MPSLGNIIGQASRGADLYFVFRFLRLLTMKYTSTDAYKLGIIDKKGKALKKSADLESIKEKAAYTMLHRLVFKIRGLIEKVPLVGKSILLNYAAALFLLKEQKDPRIWTDDIYMKTKLLEFLETNWEADAKFLKEEVDNMEKKSFTSFLSENKTIEESQELQALMALDDAGIEAVIDKKGRIVVKKKDIKKAEKALSKSFRKGGEPDLYHEEVELTEEFSEKDFDALKRGDIITIEFKSSMSSGTSKFKVTAKNIVGKAKVHKATLQNVKNPKSVKFFLYKRGNKVSLAQGDMAASVVKYTIEGVELDEATVLDVKDVDKWTTEIKKGIKAGWVSVGSSTLGGGENVAILIKLTIEPEKDWPNKILQNARFGMIRIATDGTMEMFASDRKVKNMRKTKVRSTKDVVNKINTWIKSVSEEVVIERKMTDSEKEEREEIVKKLKPKLQSFKDRYGDDAKKVMYATATKQAMEEVELDEAGDKKWHWYNLDRGVYKLEKNNKGMVVGKMHDRKKEVKDGFPNADEVLSNTKQAAKFVARKNGMPLHTTKEEVELDEEVFYWYIVQGNTQKGKVSHVGTERQLKLKIRKPIFPSGHLLLKSRKRLKVGDKWKGSYQPEEVEVDETTNSVGGGNVAGLGVGAQGEPGARPRKKKKKIDESVKMSRFAGKDVFIVDSDTYHACRLGKKQYARYEKYVGKNRIGLAIREYGLKYPKRPIILQNGDSGPMLYLKYGRS